MALAEEGQTGEPAAPLPASGPVLSIDTRNAYPGMDKCYAEGYSPAVSGDRAVVVLPLLSQSGLADSTITANVNLGNPENAPFIFKNYEKQFKLKQFKVGKDEKSCYLVRFTLDLKQGRLMGEYPVVVSVRGVTREGESFEQDFTLYVSVPTGKDPSAATAAPASEKPASQPKLILESYALEPETLQAGAMATLALSIRNTSATQNVQNIKLTFREEIGEILPVGAASAHFPGLGKNGTMEWRFDISVSQLAAERPHIATVTMEYEDNTATPIQTTDVLALFVRQPVRLEYEQPSLPVRVTEGDNISFSMNFMNLGKSGIYNLLLTFEMPGLNNGGSVLVGELPAGESKAATTNLRVSAMEGRYGDSVGKLLVSYEDSYGELYETEIPLQTAIEKKLEITAATPATEDKAEKNLFASWWVWPLLGVALAAGALLTWRHIKIKKAREEDERRL